MSPPKQTVYAVITHGSSPRVSRSAAPMSGSATFTTVTSRMSISWATASSASATWRALAGAGAAPRPALVTGEAVIGSPPHRLTRTLIYELLSSDGTQVTRTG